MILTLIALFYVLSARALSNYGEGKKIGKYGSFFTSIVLTPIIGLFITSRSRDLTRSELIENEIKKDFFRRNSGEFKINPTDMVSTLLALNVVMFVLEIWFIKTPLISQICLSFNKPELYQFITHQFIHGSVDHLYSNMIALILVGGKVEDYLGKTKFIISYLLCGVIGALFEIYFMKGHFKVDDTMAGASGAVFGMIALFALTSKDYMKIFKWKVRLSSFAWGMIISEVWTALQFRSDGIGHFAHTGGIVCGIIIFILSRYARKREVQ
jgi:membrane associated rhomboid family serine protease